MNKCSISPDNVNLYIDNEMSDAEKIIFEKHMNQCNSCKQDYFDFMSMSNLMSKSFDEDIPEDYNVTLRRRLMNKVNSGDLKNDEVNEIDSLDNISPKNKPKSGWVNTWSKVSFAATAMLVLGIFAKTGYFENFINRYKEAETIINSSQSKGIKTLSESTTRDSTKQKISPAQQSGDVSALYGDNSETKYKNDSTKSKPGKLASAGLESGINKDGLESDFDWTTEEILGQMNDRLGQQKDNAVGNGMKFKGTATMGVGVGKTPEEAMKNAKANQQSTATQGGYDVDKKVSAEENKLVSQSNTDNTKSLVADKTQISSKSPEKGTDNSKAQNSNNTKLYLYISVSIAVALIVLILIRKYF